MNKKIHVITKFFYPVAAGIETNIMETYTVLAKRGWEVTIFTTKDSHIKRNIYDNQESLRGLKIRRFSKWSYFLNVSGVLSNKPDIIALHNFDMLPHFFILIYTLMLKLVGKKSYALVVTPHGGFNPEWRVFKPLSAFLKRNYHYSIGSLLLNLSADLIRAVSLWEKEEMIKHGLKNKLITVIPNGIEDEGFMNVEKLASSDVKARVKSWGDYIIQVGRIYPIKNYETIIKAIPNLPKNINFVIVGPISDTQYKKKLEDLASTLGVSGRLRFGGVIRGIDKFYVIKKSCAMVHMAIWESFCNVIHEAMSQGTPIIAANNTALPYLIRNNVNGFLVDTFDSSGLVAAVKHVLNPKNSKSIQTIVQTNLKQAKKETWYNTALMMEKAYIDVL